MIAFKHRHEFIDNLLYLVFQDLSHIQLKSNVTSLVASQRRGALRKFKLFRGVIRVQRFLDSSLHAFYELGHTSLTELPFLCVHHTWNLFTIVRHNHLGEGSMRLWNILDLHLSYFIFIVLNSIASDLGVRVIYLVKVDDLTMSRYYLIIVSN